MSPGESAMARDLLERDLEAQVREYLALRGFLPVKTDAGRRYLPGRSQGGRALPPGFPDLLALAPLAEGSGLFLGALVELKAPGGQLRESQRGYGRVLEAHRIPHHLVRSLEALLRLGLPEEAEAVRRRWKEKV